MENCTRVADALTCQQRWKIYLLVLKCAQEQHLKIENLITFVTSFGQFLNYLVYGIASNMLILSECIDELEGDEHSLILCSVIVFRNTQNNLVMRCKLSLSTAIFGYK